MTSTVLTYDIRSYRPADETAVLALMRTALGWQDDARFTTLFRWKHLDGPWGPSPAWVAVANDEIVGYRALMRWRFLLDGQPVDAVRAVDTATRGDFRGQGIFRRLTLHGIDAVREQGVGFVFNTPNDQSRPGYLKMGWRAVGQLPVAITAPRRLSSVRRVLSARTSASLWSLPSDAGSSASEFLADHAEHLAVPRDRAGEAAMQARPGGDVPPRRFAPGGSTPFVCPACRSLHWHGRGAARDHAELRGTHCLTARAGGLDTALLLPVPHPDPVSVLTWKADAELARWCREPGFTKASAA